MTTNNVTVNIAFGAGAEGNFLFAASGTLVSDANLAIVTPVVQGVLDSTGSGTAVLLASDNFSPGELLWNVFATVRGFPRIHVTGFQVNFASGATQALLDILKASGWPPDTV